MARRGHARMGCKPRGCMSFDATMRQGNKGDASVVTSLRISVVFLAAAFVAGGCVGAAPTTTTAPTATRSALPCPTPAATPTAAPTATRSVGFSATNGPMAVDRWGHTATLLPSCKVLIAGGRGGPEGPDTTAAAELYDPSADTFTATGSMASRRVGHAATLLTNGKVLITGGEVEQGMNIPNLKSAELYDPATGSFSPTGSMSSPREGHTATLLANGKVLIAGGTTAYMNGYLASAELYDPSTGSFSSTGSMTTARTGQTATLLSSGKVLLTGGIPDDSSVMASAELYDPATGAFSATGSMSSSRWAHTATLLRTGKVLIVGGTTFSTLGDYLASAELYDPATGVFRSTGSMSSPRLFHTATLLASGKVLIAGGVSDPYESLETPAQVYDPDEGTFAAIGSLTTPRARHTATLLTSGEVLIAGGDGGGSLPSAELYTP
jgi:hypothetical protein